MIKEKVVIATKEVADMTNIQAATLITKMYADLVARLKFNNLVPDPNYAEAVALAVMALREEV